MIVDTHIHVLGADRKKYPRQLHPVLAPHFAWTQDDYTAEQLLADMDRCGIDRFVRLSVTDMNLANSGS